MLFPGPNEEPNLTLPSLYCCQASEISLVEFALQSNSVHRQCDRTAHLLSSEILITIVDQNSMHPSNLLVRHRAFQPASGSHTTAQARAAKVSQHRGSILRTSPLSTALRKSGINLPVAQSPPPMTLPSGHLRVEARQQKELR